MSRSYKEPVVKYGNDPVFGKRQSNKQFRKALLLLDSGFKSSIFKKKIYNPYNIVDGKLVDITDIKLTRK